ncbi:hypothetical protein KDH_26680 [Dictyobacter sp. S3.2.2.5]|uniref:Uncharacterized protein n=1 Tax=Dictyobacter halimunensis TaxID=3026934 RepID=A0ABQ6FNZ9_9CHLR|nr:hypothetical protein KDH_15960 [Dictyobacter sp. S3.2.2.5]GLV55824.1 hypothetical protein KDH_26680 [Dictyobacter sp. S3.2.2.5]
MRCAFFCWKEGFPFHDSRFEPGFNDSSDFRRSREFVQEGLMVDEIKAFGDIRIQDIFIQFVDTDPNGRHRIVA